MDEPFERMNQESLDYVPTTTHAIDHLAGIIRTRILGVHPDSQDVQLYDDDWHLIMKALMTLKEVMP